MNAIQLHHLGAWFYNHHMKVLAKIIDMLIWIFYNSYIPSSAVIGKGTKCGYKGIGVVIHKRAVIGENCIIAQQVTIGGRSGKDGVPVLGNNVYCGAGAKILGDVHIGDNTVIGANAVVLKDTPPTHRLGWCTGKIY